MSLQLGLSTLKPWSGYITYKRAAHRGTSTLRLEAIQSCASAFTAQRARIKPSVSQYKLLLDLPFLLATRRLSGVHYPWLCEKTACYEIRTSFTIFTIYWLFDGSPQELTSTRWG